jgi:Tfp pilus assembly protein PilN
MDYTTSTWILSGVVSVLLLLSMFLLREYYFSQKNEGMQLSKEICKLNETLSKLDKMISSNNASMFEKHRVINNRLRNHDEHLENLGVRVNEVEGEVKVIKSKVR